MTSLWWWDPESVVIVHILVINHHKLSLQVAKLTGAHLWIFQAKPIVVHITVPASKSEIDIALHDISNVAKVITEPSLVWKMSLFHFEKVHSASVAWQDVQVCDWDTQVVARPRKHGPLAVLFSRIRERMVLWLDYPSTVVKYPSTCCREREREREREEASINTVH